MSLMCEECKCTTDGVTGCDNGCQCCNDPQYVSDSDALASVTFKAHLALHRLNMALAIFNDPCDGDSLELAIQQVEHAVKRLNTIKGIK
jgi:hypothetical protein